MGGHWISPRFCPDCEHYPPRPAGAIERQPRTHTGEERAFLAIGPGAEPWLITAAAADTTRLRRLAKPACRMEPFVPQGWLRPRAILDPHRERETLAIAPVVSTRPDGLRVSLRFQPFESCLAKQHIVAPRDLCLHHARHSFARPCALRSRPTHVTGARRQIAKARSPRPE
jgi:hypothetical protein